MQRTRKQERGCLVPTSTSQVLSERRGWACRPILGWPPSVPIRAKDSILPGVNHCSSQRFRHQCVVPFPILLLQLCDTTWLPYLSIQFGHYLPGVSMRSHRLRAQSRKTIHISDATHKSQVVTETSDLPAISSRGSHNPLSASVIC